jgi:hypothetical protein
MARASKSKVASVAGGRNLRTAARMADHPELSAISDAWRAGTSPLCAGSTSYVEALPERDSYSVELRRDGTVIARFWPFDLELKFRVMYGKHEPTSRWAYEPPAHAAEVYGPEDR